ncbi:hypothetical protein [Halovulum sp. GXIMD14793]
MATIAGTKDRTVGTYAMRAVSCIPAPSASPSGSTSASFKNDPGIGAADIMRKIDAVGINSAPDASGTSGTCTTSIATWPTNAS